MNSTQTLEQLQQLRLQGMAGFYQSQLELPIHQQLEAHDLIASMTQSEVLSRSNERMTYYLKLAKLRLAAHPENVECSSNRNLTKQQLASLLEGQYIQQAEPVLITGPTGCGKSYLACALAYQACMQGHRTLYFNMNRFIEKVTLAKLDGTYLRQLNHWERTPLIILDDFGLQPLDQQIRLALLQLVEDRYARKSIIITSQLPVAKWYEFINEPTLADAILDRLTAKAHRVELKGESLRKKKQDPSR
ncbi:MAG: IS21-like element helper ATPase IstB [Chitinophagales bacterium]|nr:IS21-like element helper ATPase IstB [Chitinophagales bacterium]